MNKIKIGIISNATLFTEGITSLLNNENDFTVTLKTENYIDFKKKIINDILPDVIIVDVDNQNSKGTELVKSLKKSYPQCKLIIISLLPDSGEVLSMIRLGVHGYILKSTSVIELFNSIRTISNNELYYPSFVTDILIKNLTQKEFVKLNSREIEFLRLVATDMTYKEIADKMLISARTADGYRDQLFEKLSIKSRVGLVLYAIKNNIIDLELPAVSK